VITDGGRSAVDPATIVGRVAGGDQLVKLGDGADSRDRDEVAAPEPAHLAFHAALLVGAVGAGLTEARVDLRYTRTADPAHQPADVLERPDMTANSSTMTCCRPSSTAGPWQLHPLAVLIGIAAGGSLFGLVGTFFAGPVRAVGLNAYDGFRRDDADNTDEPPPRRSSFTLESQERR
jgi:hypothetical protein